MSNLSQIEEYKYYPFVNYVVSNLYNRFERKLIFKLYYKLVILVHPLLSRTSYNEMFAETLHEKYLKKNNFLFYILFNPIKFN